MKSVKTTVTEWKLLLKRVKIIPKWVKITPKRVKITPMEWISLFGEAHRGTALLFSAVPLWAPPKVKVTLLEWFSLSSEWFSLALEWLALVLRVIFTRLEWSLRFSLFWRVTISLFYIKRVYFYTHYNYNSLKVTIRDTFQKKLAWHSLKGLLHLLPQKAPKLACFVLYLQITDIFLKNDICIL